jgi:hypothetical protein
VRVVPGVTPKIQLPPDFIPFIGENVITTIVDTNNADLRLSEFSSETKDPAELDKAPLIG